MSLIVDFSFSVKISSSQMKKIKLHLELAGKALDFYLQKEGLLSQKVKGLHCSLILCGESKIKKLNANYRNKNKVTDVLSFPTSENLRKSFSDAEFMGDALMLGDLAVCHQKTIAQAREFKLTYEEEFIHLVIHGILHLMGYDHEISVKEEKLMEDWEKKILEKISEYKKKGAR